MCWREIAEIKDEEDGAIWRERNQKILITGVMETGEANQERRIFLQYTH